MIPLFVVFKRLWAALRSAWRDAAFRGLLHLGVIVAFVTQIATHATPARPPGGDPTA